MTFPRARLWVSAGLFLAWLGYLLFLVILSRQTIVLSRPQFLVAGLCVLAELSDDHGKPAKAAQVLEVFWTNEVADLKLKGRTIAVENLPEAGPQGYVGPGKYILPVRKQATPIGPFYTVMPIPSSPGYLPAFVNVKMYAAGSDPERAARLAHQDLGIDESVARAKIDEITTKHQGMILAWGIPRERAVEFVKSLNDTAAKASPDAKGIAEVTLPGNDIRIYPLTPATKEQLDEMIAAR